MGALGGGGGCSAGSAAFASARPYVRRPRCVLCPTFAYLTPRSDCPSHPPPRASRGCNGWLSLRKNTGWCLPETCSLVTHTTPSPLIDRTLYKVPSPPLVDPPIRPSGVRIRSLIWPLLRGPFPLFYPLGLQPWVNWEGVRWFKGHVMEGSLLRFFCKSTVWFV